MNQPTDREVIFEIERRGQYARITAMDVATLTEATMVGPIRTQDAELKRLVLQKLDYILRRDEKTNKKGGGGDKGGILV